MSEKYYSEQDEIRRKTEKSTSKAVIITGLVMFIAGLILAVIGGIICHNTDLNKYYETADFNNTFSVSDVNNISIDMENCDITIKKTNEKDIRVTATSVSEKYKAELSGDTLMISSPKTKNFMVNITLFTNIDPKVEIALPEKEYEKLDLRSGVGDIDMSDLKFGDIIFNTGTGDNELNNITCGKMDITCGVGDSEISNITCDSCSFAAGTGDMEIRNITSKGELRIKSGVGDTDISGAEVGGFSFETGTGDTEFAGTVNGNIKVDAGVGDIELALTNPESDFGAGGKYTMSIEKGTGDKKITYNN